MNFEHSNQRSLFLAGRTSILRATQMLDEGRAVEAADLALDIWEIGLRQGAAWGLMGVATGAEHGADALAVVESAWPSLSVDQGHRLATRVRLIAQIDLSPSVILEREIDEMSRLLMQGGLEQRFKMLQELMVFEELMHGDLYDAFRAETVEAFLAAAPDESRSYNRAAKYIVRVLTDVQDNVDRAEQLTRAL
jgi:hypothetical protein